MQLTHPTKYIAGAVLLTIPTIEIGGWFLTRVVRGFVPMTPFQKTFARAGHAHAGVLVTLSLVWLLFTDATDRHGALGWVGRLAVPAAILMSAGFFLSSMGRGEVTRPNRLIALVWLGAVSLAVGMITIGLGLVTN